MHIVYVGPFEFPSSNANSLRVKGLANALVLAGHQITVLNGSATSIISSNPVSYAGVQVHPIAEYHSGLLARCHRGLRGLFLGDVTVKELEAMPEKPDAVILYGTHFGYLTRLLSFCQKNALPLFVDAVEWYDPRDLPGGRFGPFSLVNELSMRFLAKRANGLFVISEYLEEHFRKSGCKTHRVPPLFTSPIERPRQYRASDNAIHLCYAGAPGKKEDLQSILKAWKMAVTHGKRLTLHMIGLVKGDVESDLLEVNPDAEGGRRIKFYGRVENSVSQEIVASCDFTVLLRPDRRVTRAGFPSKVAESLRLGTPVIANLSSNLIEYLVDETNAIIVADCTAEAFSTALERVSLLDESRIDEMKERARSSGEHHFSTTTHYIHINAFIKQVCDDK